MADTWLCMKGEGIKENVCQIKLKFIEHQPNASLFTNVISLNNFIVIYCHIYCHHFTDAQMKQQSFRKMYVKLHNSDNWIKSHNSDFNLNMLWFKISCVSKKISQPPKFHSCSFNNNNFYVIFKPNPTLILGKNNRISNLYTSKANHLVLFIQVNKYHAFIL